jgi:hypothetical protein
MDSIVSALETSCIFDYILVRSIKKISEQETRFRCLLGTRTAGFPYYETGDVLDWSL